MSSRISITEKVNWRSPSFSWALAMIWLGGTPAQADPFIDLGTAPSGYEFDVGGLNNVGQAFYNAIQYNSQNYVTSEETFLYSGGQTTNIGSLGEGVTQAAALNDAGQIVGTSSLVQNGQAYPFVYSNGSFTRIGGPNGSIGTATAINNNGQVVGFFAGAYGALTPFLYSQNQVTLLAQVPGTTQTYPMGINNAGQILFQVEVPKGQYLEQTFAVLQTGSQSSFIVLDPNYMTDGAFDVSRPSALNANGQVVGDATLPCSCTYPLETGFLYSAGTTTGIPLPGGSTDSNANSINDSGEILIYGYIGQSPVSFLYFNGVYTDLNALMPGGWSYESFLQINDSGQIFGVGELNGEEHAFILDTATAPEPASWALFGFGVMGLGMVARKKNLQA